MSRNLRGPALASLAGAPATAAPVGKTAIGLEIVEGYLYQFTGTLCPAERGPT